VKFSLYYVHEIVQKYNIKKEYRIERFVID
jgi:hypothetical protein